MDNVLKYLRILPEGGSSKLLYSDTHPSNKWCLLSCSFLLHLLSLALPLTMMQVYDRILLSQSMATLSWLVGGCGLAILMECGLKYLKSRLSQLLAARFENASARNVVTHLINSRLEQFELHSPSKHLERLQSLSKLKNFYSGQLYQVILDLPFSLIFLFAIAHLGGWIVSIPLFFGMSYIGLVFVCRKQFDLHNQTETGRHEKRQSFLIQLLENLPTVKGLNIENPMLRRYEVLQSQKLNARSTSNHWAELPGLLGPSFSQITMFGTILLCSRLVLDGQMTLGGLTACMMLSSRALQPLQQSASFWIKLPAIKHAHREIVDIENMEKDIQDQETSAQPHDLEGEFKLKNLSFKYQNTENWILNDINLDIPAKSMIGITGPSKNGSTTLIMLMMGLLRADKGDVYLDGYPIQKLSRQALEGKMQYLPRNGVLFKGSIIDNITSFKPNRQSLALSTATMLGLDPLIAALPQGYETLVDSRAKVSIEIIHRINLARSLVCRPRILIIDKTTVTMDRRSEQIFLDLVHKLRSICTIIVVSQWPYLLGLCDSVYELKDTSLKPRDLLPSRGTAVQ
jgi:ATP-binding cassette, subfamily C, bacterial LapB